MGKASTTKGKRGEQEVVRLVRAAGLSATRMAPLQAHARTEGCPDVAIHGLHHLHIEVKRDERMSVDAMVRQAISDSHPGTEPCVFWRRNKGQWRADVPLEYFLQLLASWVRA